MREKGDEITRFDGTVHIICMYNMKATERAGARRYDLENKFFYTVILTVRGFARKKVSRSK